MEYCKEMAPKELCIAIPEELQRFRKQPNIKDNTEARFSVADFGVQTVRKADGCMDFVAYFSDDGDLLKRIFYDGSVLAHIMYYRNGLLHKQEDFEDGKLIKKIRFNNAGERISNITYAYNRKGNMASIQKTHLENCYKVEYGYDELERVNGRKFIINNEIAYEQYYRYDILDRIVLYKDTKQTITVNEVGKHNKLVSYAIQDKMLNNIKVYNKFIQDNYIETEIVVNGHRMIIKDQTYVDNTMLRRPYTREDDLDFMMTNLFRQTDSISRQGESSNTNEVRINVNMQPPILPISIRKRQLLYSRAGF